MIIQFNGVYTDILDKSFRLIKDEEVMNYSFVFLLYPNCLHHQNISFDSDNILYLINDL